MQQAEIQMLGAHKPDLLTDRKNQFQGSVGEIILVVGTAVAGVTALAASTMGYLRGNLVLWERVLLGGGAVALIFPDLMSDAFGLLVLLFIFFRTNPPNR